MKNLLTTLVTLLFCCITLIGYSQSQYRYQIYKMRFQVFDGDEEITDEIKTYQVKALMITLYTGLYKDWLNPKGDKRIQLDWVPDDGNPWPDEYELTESQPLEGEKFNARITAGGRFWEGHRTGWWLVGIPNENSDCSFCSWVYIFGYVSNGEEYKRIRLFLL